MIPKKEFYFIRHGQTDHNLLDGLEKGDHPFDIPLNATGKQQAITIEPIISRLPIQTICASPMTRVQETKDIIAARLTAPHHIIDELSECSSRLWKEMVRLEMHSTLPAEGEVRIFMERVRKGIDHALSLPGPVLIVAHGGVHWATCCLMNIKTYEWRIENCGLVHFSIGTQGEWTAKKLQSRAKDKTPQH
jgi:probable phosphoglycerate mutase